jgi:hypothetical protein
MYSGKIAVPPGGGGIRIKIAFVSKKRVGTGVVNSQKLNTRIKIVESCIGIVPQFCLLVALKTPLKGVLCKVPDLFKGDLTV